MRLILAWVSAVAFAASFFFLSALPASAVQIHFSSPGWYRIEYGFLYAYIVAGPIADKGTCEAGSPPKDEDKEYGCEYLSERPSWDK